ncbi:murein hydrolase activator EnvC family protein [Candidatus Neomarinimicrobiota bacterium]
MKTVAYFRLAFYFRAIMHMRSIIICFFSIIVAEFAIGQSSAEIDALKQQIDSSNAELRQIRAEIAAFESRIAIIQQTEKDALAQLNELEERILLTSRLVQSLTQETGQLTIQIAQAEQQIAQDTVEIAQLRAQLAERIIRLYKQPRASVLELLLTSQDWNMAATRAKYLRVAADYDRDLTERVKTELAQLRSRQQQLAEAKVTKVALLAETTAEERQLRSMERQRQEQIEAIRQDFASNQRQLTERLRAENEIERMVTGLSETRQQREAELAEIRQAQDLDMVADINFYRGKLPWPALGPVITRFGLQRDPQIGTITENNGIDIRADQGSPVRAILSGLVTVITYMPGFGTTLIIDHGKDLYSVYAHLEDVQVRENGYVDQDDVIARVGSSGSLDGPMLHFEVYVRQEKQDPELWLASRTTAGG